MCQALLQPGTQTTHSVLTATLGGVCFWGLHFTGEETATELAQGPLWPIYSSQNLLETSELSRAENRAFWLRNGHLL